MLNMFGELIIVLDSLIAEASQVSSTTALQGNHDTFINKQEEHTTASTYFILLASQLVLWSLVPIPF